MNRTPSVRSIRLGVNLSLTLMVMAVLGCRSADAQRVGTTIQLPTFRVTQFNSSFSVPDGGTINLGGTGVSRTTYPGRVIRSGRNGVGIRSIDSRNRERELLSKAMPGVAAEAFPRLLTHRQVNGRPATQSKADFLSKHIQRHR